MTICIAAICKQQRASRIIFCFDSKLSYEWGSADTGIKLRIIAPGVIALLAGRWDRVNRLADFYASYLNGNALLGSSIEEQIKEPLRRFRRALMDDETAKHGLSIDEFFATQTLPKPLEDQIMRSIQNIDIDCQIIISAFMSDGKPIIARVDNDGIHISRSFEAIGTGAYLAQMVLDERGYSPKHEIQSAAYMVYEAKRFSEKAEGVNDTTHMMFLAPSSQSSKAGAAISSVSDIGFEFLEKSYKRFGLQPVRIDALPSDFFFSPDQLRSRSAISLEDFEKLYDKVLAELPEQTEKLSE